MRFLYFMYAPSYPFRFKIGISGRLLKRRRQIAASLTARGAKPARCWIIFAFPMFGAERTETKLHARFARHRRAIPGASGGTEFFSIKIIPFAFFFTFFYIIFELLIITGLIIFIWVVIGYFF
jgi:hypothetical protein